MGAPSKGKRGPKKGWLDKLHADPANYKDEAEYLRSLYVRQMKETSDLRKQRTEYEQRLSTFNGLGYWHRLFHVLFGGGA